MKKFFLTLLVIGLLIGAGIAFLVVRGGALDKESKAYADAAIPAIVTNWSEKALIDRASPELMSSAPRQKFDQLFRWFGSLGRLQSAGPAEGESLMSVTTQAGRQITAHYTVKARFEKGDAAITLALIKHGDDWQISGFHVDSPALVAK